MRPGTVAATASVMAVASFTASAIMSLSLVRDPSAPVEGNQILLEAAVSSCYEQADVQGECIEKAVNDSVTRTGIVPTAWDLVAVLREDQDFGGICHEAMHWLGQMAAVDYASHVNELMPAFPMCAFGLMHGMMESLPLPNDSETAVGELRSLCSMLTEGRGELSPGSEAYLVQVDCAHGSGHSLGKSFPDELSFAFDVCREAFSPDSRLVADCFNGVAMVDASLYTKEVAQADTSEDVPLEVWDSLAEKVCPLMGDLEEKACPGAFVQAAVDNGPHAERGYLKWCKERYPSVAALCYDSVGSALGVVSRSLNKSTDQVAQELAEVCSVGGDDDLAIECWSALGNGLTQRGLSNGEAGDMSCRYHEEYLDVNLAERACKASREKLGAVVLEAEM